jgi:hypothetical protein
MTRKVISTEFVELRLSDAGKTYTRLKVGGSWPAGYRSVSLDAPADANLAYGYEAATIDLGPPTAAAIDRMREVESWLPLIRRDQWRWAVAQRLPANPITGTALQNWRRLGRKVHKGESLVRYWHEQGLLDIAHALSERSVLRVRA